MTLARARWVLFLFRIFESRLMRIFNQVRDWRGLGCSPRHAVRYSGKGDKVEKEGPPKLG